MVPWASAPKIAALWDILLSPGGIILPWTDRAGDMVISNLSTSSLVLIENSMKVPGQRSNEYYLYNTDFSGCWPLLPGEIAVCPHLLLLWHLPFVAACVQTYLWLGEYFEN